MRDRFRTTLAVTSALLLGGCLSSNVVLTVRPDGSGTIRQSLAFRPSAMAEVDALVSLDPGAPRRGIAAPSDMQQRLLDSRNFGQYVRLISSTPDRAPDRAGRTAVFEFDDVSKVAIDLVPQTPLPVQGFLPILGFDATTRLTFELSTIAGGNRRLTIRFPRFPLDPSAEPPGQWATGSAEELAALKRVFRDARIRLAVEPSTPILASNSPHRSDTDVVLFEMDAETALFSRQIDMLRATPASFDELLLMLGDLPGVTLAPNHVITIDFRGPDVQTPAAQPAPDTEIYLAPLSSADGKLTLGTPVNITKSPGYDNQPSFTPDGASILFTSARGAQPASPAGGQSLSATDIYRYDIAANRTVQITRTPEGEYSPAVMPDGQRFSVVRVEAGGTQRLWSFALDGSDPKVVLTDIKPVGYYTWVDGNTVALFILGQDGKPATLQVADVSSGKATVVTERIGRSVQRMPSGGVSFVQQADPGGPGGGAVIKQLFDARAADRASMGVGILVPAVAGSADPQLAWMPDGTVLAAAGGTLYRWKSGDTGWTPVADLGALGLANVSRLAVSPKGDRLALVNQAR